jgi:hypothetical protein
MISPPEHFIKYSGGSLSIVHSLGVACGPGHPLQVLASLHFVSLRSGLSAAAFSQIKKHFDAVEMLFPKDNGV